MNWDFVAETPSELAEGIAPALLTGRATRTVANEKIQMLKLLKALAGEPLMQFPVCVRHTSDKVPDFQLLLGGRRIAVELTRIKFQDVEHGRALQERGLARTLSVTSLYPALGGPRKKTDVIGVGFGVPAFFFPPSYEEERRIWTAQAKESLAAKTGVVGRSDFVHGDEDWLALVDTVGEQPEEAQDRNESLASLLAGFWKPGWYSRVFLQDNFYRWQTMFAPDGFRMLQALH